MSKTFMAKPQTVESKWYIVDATNMPLGRLASQVASILRGKNKPEYTPHVDTGDYVIVINTDKMVLTGKKLTDKKRNFEKENIKTNLLFHFYCKFNTKTLIPETQIWQKRTKNSPFFPYFYIMY